VSNPFPLSRISRAVPPRVDFIAISMAEQLACWMAFSTASWAIWYMAEAILVSIFKEGSTFTRSEPVKRPVCGR